jgi:hypothetical protein
MTYHKAGLLLQYPRKYQAKKVMKFRVRWNENVPKISIRRLAINTEFLLAFYKSNSQMRVF